MRVQKPVSRVLLALGTAILSLPLTLLLGTGGVKFNLSGNLLISASVLFPLTNAGLRSRVTTVIGLDYAF